MNGFFKSWYCGWLGGLLLLSAHAMSQTAEAGPAVPPPVLGADVGNNGFSAVWDDYWNHEPMYQACAELGLTHLDVHLGPVTARPGLADGAAQTKERIRQIDEQLRRHKMSYDLNLELSNWLTSCTVTTGRDEFSPRPGLHRWDLRFDWLAGPRAATQGNVGLRALVYDECDHMVLSNNRFANPSATFDQPFLANTHGLPLPVAYERLVKAATRLRTGHYHGQVPLATEQVWPDLYHIFARAGWRITPKLLKEEYNTIMLAVSLGAAGEYADRTHWSVTPDLWNFEKYPGHSVQALHSALLLGYWLGAESIYVENLDFMWPGSRHADAVTSGSLISVGPHGDYTVTAYGRVVQDFAKSYIPTHPRHSSWRDYRPRVAIIRMPDGGWGQADDRKDYICCSRNRLLGNRDHPLDEPAREWLQVWPILTHQALAQGELSLFGPGRPDPWAERFVPIDSVTVFDHRVSGPILDGIECFIVCGHDLSTQTFNAIAKRVAANAAPGRPAPTCIISRRLYEQHARRALPGDWLVVESFSDPAVAAKLQPFLGPPDVMRWRYAHEIIEFRKGAQRDQLEVTIKPR